MKMSQRKGIVIWITGLSGAGKSTIARALVDLYAKKGEQAVLLDGDEIRAAVADPKTAHDRRSRLVNAMRICRFAKLLANQGFTVIVATMSLFEEVHRWNRKHQPDYFEVFVKVSLGVLRARDARKLYSRARQGRAANVVGVDMAFDEPDHAHLVLDNEQVTDSFTALAGKILTGLKRRSRFTQK
jgi:adenylylsulfate kinase